MDCKLISIVILFIAIFYCSLGSAVTPISSIATRLRTDAQIAEVHIYI